MSEVTERRVSTREGNRTTEEKEIKVSDSEFKVWEASSVTGVMHY